MKHLILLLATVIISGGMAAGQTESQEKSPNKAVSIGLLHGGGSLVGADFEILVSERVGLQVGAGIVGLGAGLNYHLKPTISSSMISLLYWHQGIGEYHTQSLVGPSFVFRANKLFTASLGLGYALGKGPAWPSDKVQPPVMLTYSIGVYLPLR
jgi:hypothetical protein